MIEQPHQTLPGQPARLQPQAPGMPRTMPYPPPVRAPITPSPHMLTVADEDLEPISLYEESHAPLPAMAPPPPPKKIQAFGVETSHKKREWKRQTVKTGTGASRVKSFHGKYSEQGLEYLDNAVNDWLDNNPDIEVKFVTPTVMTFEGKIREPALVLNVWY